MSDTNKEMTVQIKPRISVVLPTYNERENINDLVFELRDYISNHITDSFELIIVDDDSPDLTWKAAQDYYVNEPRVKVIRRLEGRRLASAIWKGIQEAKGDIIAWMDCDFSMPAFKLIELIKEIDEGYDVVVGSRFIKGGKDIRGPTDSLLAAVLSKMMNFFISFVLGGSFKDYTSGFVAVKKKVFDEIQINGDYGEYFIDFIYNVRKRGYKIIELPYYCMPRRSGDSKTGDNLMDYLKRGWKYILLTLRLRLRGNNN
jgi:dolichol-phosphate mannosyltransferase